MSSVAWLCATPQVPHLTVEGLWPPRGRPAAAAEETRQTVANLVAAPHLELGDF